MVTTLGRQALRAQAAELRAIVQGVEVIGSLPASRGIARTRLRILLSSGVPLLATLHRSAAAEAWISIEAPGLAQAVADRVAEAAMLRLSAKQ